MSVSAPEVSQLIIDQISDMDEWCIIALNNNFTPFQIVFYILKTIVPLSNDEAWNKTNKIHEQGEAKVYQGSKEHCLRIGDALKAIKVEYRIEQND